MKEVSFRFLVLDGMQEERKGVYARTDGIVMGHGAVRSQIRHKF